MAEAKLKQLLNFLRTLRGSHGAGDVACQEQRVETQKRMLQACLLDMRAGPPIEIAAATRMLEAVEVSCLSDAQKTQVVDCIQEKASPTMVAEESQDDGQLRGNKKLQKVTFLYEYFTEDEWGDLVSQKRSMSSKQRLVALRLARLGILYPNLQGPLALKKRCVVSAGIWLFFFRLSFLLARKKQHVVSLAQRNNMLFL